MAQFAARMVFRMPNHRMAFQHVWFEFSDDGYLSAFLSDDELTDSGDEIDIGDVWFPDIGYVSCDELFETDEEDYVLWLERMHILSFENPLYDEFPYEDTEEGSIEDFVSSLWSLDRIGEDADLDDIVLEDYDSGEEADDESGESVD
ncbi:DUF5319 domain-containing protein [Caenorhabditis elegans]|uniref:DUF5319 domain-containing protein n=1 Tax=Caenorhabditis elegans TaxID=6239 RepID=Q18531_CAEEL|nr:DUF5319 domain-containing protein [Caenorhabditis elegans]CCD67079.2 DUF5319 domain-containing protein [Caenorhabditis elegans]